MLNHGLDQTMRRCIAEEESPQVLKSFQASPYGGHHGGERTSHKVLQLDSSSLIYLKILCYLSMISADEWAPS